MTRHHWLILVVLSLLGMILAPARARAASLSARPLGAPGAGISLPARLPSRVVTPLPANVPSRPIPGPFVIGGPEIMLPAPAVRLPRQPVAIVARDARHAQVWPAAQASFGSPEGQTRLTLDKAFDNAGRETPPAPVLVPEPSRDRKNDPRRDRITFPEQDLLEEIGLAGH